MHFNFGSGHQHYLETIKKLIESTTAEKLRNALFRKWNYEDERLSMRWDPEDAREHAYQWTAPASEVSLTVWGANLLAAEGSTFFPVMPQDRSARTTGFRDRGARAVFTWPLWLGALTADCSRSLLSLAELSSTEPDLPRLRQRGIVAVFRCRKLKIGEGQNFKWASRLPRCFKNQSLAGSVDLILS